MSTPFDLNDEVAYQRWREQKLERAPASLADLIIEVSDPRHLTANEHAALLEICQRANMVIYAARQHAADKLAWKTWMPTGWLAKTAFQKLR
jgi:hypothetical protein